MSFLNLFFRCCFYFFFVFFFFFSLLYGPHKILRHQKYCLLKHSFSRLLDCHLYLLQLRRFQTCFFVVYFYQTFLYLQKKTSDLFDNKKSEVVIFLSDTFVSLFIFNYYSVQRSSTVYVALPIVRRQNKDNF